MVIAIDGPAGAGKSTVARAVAKALGFTYLDSGAMYRCVALATHRAGLDPGDAAAVGALAERLTIDLDGGRVALDGEDVSREIREHDVSALASLVSVHPSVRDALVQRQRALIEIRPYVAEGRDIGTVVSPDAPLKIFLTASEQERARRRAGLGGASQEELLAYQRERDRRDRERQHGALRPADDAIEVDTTGLGIGAVVDRVVELAHERGLA